MHFLKVKKKEKIRTIYEPGFKVLNNWLKLKHSGKTLKKFFEDNYINTIAIYGMGELGIRLYEELSELDVEVLYAIDQNADNIVGVENLEIITLNGNLKDVDAVIVTPIHFFDEIEKTLEEKGVKNIVSLEDVVVYCL